MCSGNIGITTSVSNYSFYRSCPNLPLNCFKSETDLAVNFDTNGNCNVKVNQLLASTQHLT